MSNTNLIVSLVSMTRKSATQIEESVSEERSDCRAAEENSWRDIWEIYIYGGARVKRGGPRGRPIALGHKTLQDRYRTGEDRRED